MVLRGELNIREQLAAWSVPTIVVVLAALLIPPLSFSQSTAESLNVRWNEGSPDCVKNPQPPLQVHAYNIDTFIIRENLCSTFESPFLYLLIGSTRALLIDTGDVSDPKSMPLADTVMRLPGVDPAKLTLLVVHTHRHQDHRAGDGQFSGLPNVQVVGFDLDSVRRFYNFTNWPNGVSEISLGGRTIDVIPTPGHNETEVSFYDRNTGLFFSGDFVMPGRLLVNDSSADLASAERVAAFVKERPVTFVLGGHIEMNSSGGLFSWESQYHPDEHVLQMTKEDLLALPAALRSFNGFYTVHGKFIIENSIHILIVLTVFALAVIVAVPLLVVRYYRRRKFARRMQEQLRS